VATADCLHDEGKYADAKAILLGAVGTVSGEEASELYWRASRETQEIGDIAGKEKKSKTQAILFFNEGEGYADMAIQSDPSDDLGYFWKSVAILGRLGQERGLINALSKVDPIKDLLFEVLSINPDRAIAWFVLGQVYRELPGWPISVGNTDFAVSLGRKAVALNALQASAGSEKGASYNFQTELAKSLYRRNWSAAKRLEEHTNKAAKLQEAMTTFEKGTLFEATVRLIDESDRQEAKSIVQEVIANMEVLPDPTASQRRDLLNAKVVFAKW
jgi:hypothetical protein